MKKAGVTKYEWVDAESELFNQAIGLKAGNGKQIAIIGSVNAKLTKAFDIDTEVFFADINWNWLRKALKGHKVLFTEISKFPEVKRDLALLVNNDVKFADIEKVAKQSETKLLKSVTLFDVYQGKNLEPGKKSYAATFILKDEEKTLKDAQIDAIMQKIQKALEDKLGAKLR